MNRLANEHIHLFLDEPIYVLADHGDHPRQSEVEEESSKYSGTNEKGICIFTEGASQEDITFLFKGLNALNIFEKDVALFTSDFEAVKNYPSHNHRLRFSEHISLDESFKIIQKDNQAILNCIPLEEIRNNQDFKRQFWEALKEMFKLES